MTDGLVRTFLPGVNMVAYDADTCVGLLVAPTAYSSADLACAAAFFLSLDRAAREIRVYTGEVLQTTYQRSGEDWAAAEEPRDTLH